MALDYGWIYVERGTGNAMQLACELFELNIQHRIMGDDLAGDAHAKIDIQIISRTLTLNNTYFKTQADAEAFLDTIETLAAAGTFTVEIRASSSTMPGSNFDIKSGVTSMEMLFQGANGVTKVARGDGVVFAIKRIVFVQGA